MNTTHTDGIDNQTLRNLTISMPQAYGVTAVLTSCSRYDLLDETLESFFKFNTFPLEKIIIVENGIKTAEFLMEKYDSKNIQWIATGKRVGQLPAIDYAYSRVKTPYIFHMEDDWEFYAPEFIEKSMQILIQNKSCLQVWLRAHNDTNAHGLEPETYTIGNISWQRLNVDEIINDIVGEPWNGFSFNPGLRRFDDYLLTNGYGTIFQDRHPKRSWGERLIGQFYRDRGMYAAILADQVKNGYVKHIGDNRRAPALPKN